MDCLWFADAWHTRPMEAGGITMAELVKALKKDALEQDKIVALVADLLEQTVNRNDKMQVALCCENPGD
jgi:hypothetical protein